MSRVSYDYLVFGFGKLITKSPYKVSEESLKTQHFNLVVLMVHFLNLSRIPLNGMPVGSYSYSSWIYPKHYGQLKYG